ncbi:glycosyltransferase family 2 protein [Roseitranquillus sediminis]|uniref:glycosyltransferase family 2 protein n=1 Tax=Roseitranquillus sediminis TaxID=2809051 RepID=UPI001D0C5589|nr:glycosyltransferase family 2 protein [Roseitranquillus sediminis]MBM9593506.1 glycosyltransferase family 2 protein [Roseitranquillus sediminis]
MLSVTIVIPMQNEAENVVPLIDEIAAAMAGRPDWEIIAVNDGSTDGTGEALRAAAARVPSLRILRHAQSAGQSAAIHAGVRAARAPSVATLDGDGQNPPADLPRLLDALAAGGERLGLVAGQRAVRRDSVAKQRASRVANSIRARMLGDGVRDTGCGLKAFRRDAFLALPYFDHMHRFLPALFVRDGWEVQLVDVGDRPRRAGVSKYTNLQRALVGVTDIFGVLWLIRRRRRCEAVEEVAVRPAEAAE